MSEAPYRVTATTEHFHGRVFSAVTDTVVTPDGASAPRDYIRHSGAVAVVAVDAEGNVILVRQYRHPVRAVLWELPAGLLDVEGEDAATAAGRELAEETNLVAASIEPLIEIYTSPGFSDERIPIFLARDLAPVGPEHTFERVFEEATMTTHPVPFAEALSMVDRGEIVNGVCVLGLLAAARRLRIS